MKPPVQPAQRALKKDLTSKTSRRRRDLTASTAIRRAAAARGRRNDLSPPLKVARRRIEELKPANRQIRRTAKAHTERLVRVISITGVCAPILIDKHDRVIDGHSVVEAAKALGIESLPCVLIEHLTDSEIEFLKVAINRVSECGDWDLDELRPLLIDLRDEGFVLTDTCFSIPELDIIVLDDASSGSEQEDEVTEPPEAPVTREGDLFILDGHRIYCGDSTQLESYAAVLECEKAAAIFTDPPWNIPIKGFVSSQHEDFKMGAGEMAPEAFAEFTSRFSECCVEVLEDEGVMFTCIDWRSMQLIIGCALEAGLQLINTAVWNKGSGGMGGLYRSAHELIPVFCKGKSPRVNNVELGRHGRDRTNVWSYPGANRRGSSASEALKHHPTPKPVDMVQEAIIDVTNPGEVVLDPFLGSGTTLLAAERSGRFARGIEIDPGYVDVCVQRWEAETGRFAVHKETGVTFTELRGLRADEETADD